MLGALALTLMLSTGAVERDAYGVPMITARDEATAWRLMGQAAAEDRLWQMELARRQARGRLAEALGSVGLASDREVLTTGYTDAELAAQLRALRPATRQAFESYAMGVNDALSRRAAAGTLPPGYAENGFKPEPWTALDSVAIGVRLARLFGSGGEGELRNYLLYFYLKSQRAGDRALDVMDDLVWQNDPSAPTTIARRDEPPRTVVPEIFAQQARHTTERHLAQLPPSSILELAPTIRAATREDSALFAQAHGLVYKSGSYVVVASAQRSTTGRPLLLSAPQMGHLIPSVVHEVGIRAGHLRVRGMAVPGLPGVLIGATPDLAWGFTSGVADVVDVFVNPKAGEESYQSGGRVRPLQVQRREILVKGGQVVPHTVRRTQFGPVILESRVGRAFYSSRMAYWGQELRGIELVFELARARDSKAVMRAAEKSPLSFNLFFATRGGEIGYRFCGKVPVRAPGVDPRLPTPGEPQFDWRGYVPASQMPAVIDPRDGLLLNWNNKPVSWWPNGDTPVWGSLFRVTALRDAVPAQGKLSPEDLRQAAAYISRAEPGTLARFRPLLRQVRLAADTTESRALADTILGWDGMNTDGSVGAAAYAGWLDALRERLFVPVTGNFLSPANLRLIVQPSVIVAALEGKTKFDYLAGRSAVGIALEALGQVAARPITPWRANGFRAPDGSVVKYSDRGTYIQVVSVGQFMSTVAPPGQAESGPHSADQVPLAKEFGLKPAAW